jgi:hypothetical protein
MAAICVVGLACVGCTSASGTAATGSVRGRLIMVGGPAPGRSVPVPGTVAAYASPKLTGRPAARVTADQNGNFVLTVPAGTYYLAGTSLEFVISPSPATPPCHADRATVVTKDTTSHVDVHCQMK